MLTFPPSPSSFIYYIVYTSASHSSLLISLRIFLHWLPFCFFFTSLALSHLLTTRVPGRCSRLQRYVRLRILNFSSSAFLVLHDCELPLPMCARQRDLVPFIPMKMFGPLNGRHVLASRNSSRMCAAARHRPFSLLSLSSSLDLIHIAHRCACNQKQKQRIRREFLRNSYEELQRIFILQASFLFVSLLIWKKGNVQRVNSIDTMIN